MIFCGFFPVSWKPQLSLLHIKKTFLNISLVERNAEQVGRHQEGIKMPKDGKIKKWWTWKFWTTFF